MRRTTTSEFHKFLTNYFKASFKPVGKIFFLGLLLSQLACSPEDTSVLDAKAEPAPQKEAGTDKIYKGIFTTANAEYRGTLELVFPDAVDGDIYSVAPNAKVSLKLNTGEVYEAAAKTNKNQNKQSTDFNVFFWSDDLEFDFHLDADGNAVAENVLFAEEAGDIVLAEHTTAEPVTPITGTYRCTNCEDQTGTLNGIELNNNERVFNMLLTDKAGETVLSLQAVLGNLIDTQFVIEEDCSTNGDYTLCKLKMGGNASQTPVQWSGVHKYATAGGCSTLAGNLSYTTPDLGVLDIEFMSDNPCGSNTYYISPSGSDSNSGLAPNDAWQSLAKINERNILPGETILLEGGKSFNGSLKFDSSDANDATQPVVISSYGSGKASILAGDGLGIDVYNTAGISINNLIIAGSGKNTNQKSGIQFYNDLSGDVKLDFVEVKNCEVYGFKDFGIVVGSWNHNAGFNNVLIENNKVHDILDVGISSYGYFSSSKTGYSHSNITVRNCEVFNIPGYSKGAHSGNGILLSDVQHSVIEHSTVYDSGSGNTNGSGGPVGIWYWDADQVTIQYNEVYGMSSQTKDGGGFDFDGGVTNGLMQYNYSHDNTGGGFLVGQFTGARPLRNITVRYNISENDARTNGGSIYLFNGETANDMKDIYIYNNTLFLDAQKVNSAAAGVKLLYWKPIKLNININNNIIYAANGAKLISIPAIHDAVVKGNLYHAPAGFKLEYKGSTYTSLEAFRSTGNEIVDGLPVGYEGDPLLIDAGNGGKIGFGNALSGLSAYKLDMASPAIDTGINLPYDIGSQDFFGRDISGDALPEIGAHGNLSSSGDSGIVSN